MKIHVRISSELPMMIYISPQLREYIPDIRIFPRKILKPVDHPSYSPRTNLIFIVGHLIIISISISLIFSWATPHYNFI